MIETFSATLSQTLYAISAAFLLPVLTIVVVLFATILLMLGGFLRECLDRRRVRAALGNAVNMVEQTTADGPAAWKLLSAVPVGLPHRLMQGLKQPVAGPAALGKTLAELETEITGRLNRLAFIARVGPMLGLLGTLIPFGPALAGLSSGNIQQLSGNLVTAFATTVVGLLCGCLAYAMGLVRRSWYAQDFDDLEYLVQYWKENQPHESPQTAQMGRDGRRPHGRIGQPV
jgi:biopolymer transport protein ExbB/TolQ